MQELLWAISFLTIIPLGRGGFQTRPYDLPPERMGRVMAYYPAVGLIIGLCLVLAYHLLDARFPSALVDAFIILFYVFLTGALHMDGLADSADGLLGGWDRQERLEIMKDSRIGSLGAIAIVSDLGLRFLAIQNLPDFLPEVSFWSPLTMSMDISSHTVAGLHKEALKSGIVLLAMAVVGRWAQVLVASISPYAREGGGATPNKGGRATPATGTASGLVTYTRPVHCLAASILPLLLLSMLYGARGVLVFATVCGTILLLTAYFKNRIGGVTGDTLGMTNEVAELMFLLLFFVI
jgi:adenosylcobinamide-GDP ribazoletransferase